MRPAFIVLALLGAAIAAAGEARLVSQRIAGNNRLCIYELRSLPGRGQAVATKVGMGEPCPARYRAPRAPQIREIPADARLDRIQRIGGRTICTYVRFGRRYSRSLPLNRTCPQTAGTGD